MTYPAPLDLPPPSADERKCWNHECGNRKAVRVWPDGSSRESIYCEKCMSPIIRHLYTQTPPETAIQGPR